MICTRLPETLVAGDGLRVRFSIPDAPAGAGFTLSVLLTGPAPVELASEAEGDAFVVALTSEASADLLPGRYDFAVVTFDLDGERTTHQRGQVVVQPDPAQQTGATETRSWPRRALEAVEAALLAQGGATSFSVFSRTYVFASHADLLQYRERLRREIEAEDEASRVAAGEPSRDVAWVRF